MNTKVKLSFPRKRESHFCLSLAIVDLQPTKAGDVLAIYKAGVGGVCSVGSLLVANQQRLGTVIPAKAGISFLVC